MLLKEKYFLEIYAGTAVCRHGSDTRVANTGRWLDIKYLKIKLLSGGRWYNNLHNKCFYRVLLNRKISTKHTKIKLKIINIVAKSMNN